MGKAAGCDNVIYGFDSRLKKINGGSLPIIDIPDDDYDPVLYEDEDDDFLDDSEILIDENAANSVLVISKRNLRDASLSYAERLVLSYIGGHQRGCYRKKSTLSNSLGLTRETIYRSLYGLEDRHLLMCRDGVYFVEKTRNKTRQQVFQVNDDLLKSPTREMSPKDKLVYMTIKRFLDKGWAFSYSRIGRHLGMGRASAYDAVKKLRCIEDPAVVNVLESYLEIRKNG